MKRVIFTLATAIIVVSLGAFSTSSANAVSCKAFNKGTGVAFHAMGAMGSGLYKIAAECHGG
jgi:hypothetical protein